MTRPPIYIHAIRWAKIDDEGMAASRSLAFGADEIRLVLPGATLSCRGLTLATEREDRSPPHIVPGWYTDAYCNGMHKGRAALVQQGYTVPAYVRADGTSSSKPVGLNIHDWRGNSNGCITVTADWIRAALTILGKPEQARQLRKHPDGRWCIGLLLEEA